ncbi:MAG TPA: zinc ABC transporter substrate-binding protein [Planctomycetaceae bacterium]|nr:zinc ABC transporter substrate-binding protein [Planctomycetaceae bacterium]
MLSSSNRYLPLIVLLLALTGCESDPDSSGSGGASNGVFDVVATTGHIADAVRNIAEGTSTKVTLLCGPGVDPHSYAPTAADVRSMASADAIFYNGFHLEARLHNALHHQFEDKAWAMADSFPTAARLDWVEDGEVDPDAPFDPHIWNHLPGWQTCVIALAEEMARRDPANGDQYRANGEKYAEQIGLAHDSAKAKFMDIPKERRVLVSAHDAFNYFAKVYEFETVAVLGIGNDAEADVKTMQTVATTICDRKVPVIFIENITNPKVTQALQEACQAREWNVKIAEQPLYSDDLGSEPPANTYLGAFESNVDLLTESLTKK